MDEYLSDMQSKGLAEVVTRCKYRGDKDLEEMIALLDNTVKFDTTLEPVDKINPLDFKIPEPNRLGNMLDCEVNDRRN